MADSIIDDETLQRLQEIAAQEKRSITEVLRSMVNEYRPDLPELTLRHKSKYPDWLPHTDDSPDYDPIEDFIGMFDDVEATDLSEKASGHMGKYFVEKNDDPD